MRKLPKGWRVAPISTLGELRLGKMLDKSKNRGEYAQYLRNVNVRWFSFDLTDLQTIRVDHDEKSTFDVRDGDLLICEGGEPGRAAVWSGGVNAFVYQKALHRFRTNGAIAPRLLMYQLRHLAEVGTLRDSFTGTTIKHLTRENLSRLDVVVPPRIEQPRIASKLESVLKRVHNCRQRLVRVPEILKRFRESVLAAAVSGALTAKWRSTQGPVPTFLNDQAGPWDIPATWRWQVAKDVVESGADIVYGIVQPGPKLEIGVPYVRGKDIENGNILVHQLLRTSPEIAARYSRASIKGGDVLLGIIRATKVAIVPDELDGANITQGTARFRPSAAIRTKFLAAVLESPFAQAWLHSKYRGIDMPGLNLSDVRCLPVPVPPLPEQDETIRVMSRLFDFAAGSQDRCLAARARLDRIAAGVLTKAFCGELLSPMVVDAAASNLRENRGEQVEFA